MVDHVEREGLRLGRGGFVIDLGDQQEQPAGLDDALDLADRSLQVGYVVERVEREGDVEVSIRERQGFGAGIDIGHLVPVGAELPVFVGE
jgi:hypothetical protein